MLILFMVELRTYFSGYLLVKISFLLLIAFFLYVFDVSAVMHGKPQINKLEILPIPAFAWYYIFSWQFFNSFFEVSNFAVD